MKHFLKKYYGYFLLVSFIVIPIPEFVRFIFIKKQSLKPYDWEWVLLELVLFFFLIQHFTHKKGKWLNGISTVFKNILVLIILWIILEIIFYFPYQNKVEQLDKFTTDVKGGIFTFHKDLGYWGAPGFKATATTHFNGKKYTETTYCGDQFGRRTNCNDTITISQKEKYALFFGCSYTFGVYVNDDQTMTSIFENATPDYRAYNYGMGGYGPQHTLVHLRRSIQQEIPQTEGFAVFSFVGDPHILRVVGNMRSYDWLRKHPRFALEDGELVRKGLLQEQFFLYNMYSLLSASNILKYFGIDIPYKLSEEDYQLTAAIMAASYDNYKQKFGNENFYILLWPGSGTRIKKFLRKDIKVLNYNKLIPGYLEKEKYRLKDGHPSALTYEIVAKQLNHDLDKE